MDFSPTNPVRFKETKKGIVMASTVGTSEALSEQALQTQS